MTSFTTKFRDSAYLKVYFEKTFHAKHPLTFPNSKRRCSDVHNQFKLTLFCFQFASLGVTTERFQQKKFTKYLYILASFENLQDQNAPKKYLFTFERNSCLIFELSTLLLIQIASKFRTFRSVCFIEMFTPKHWEMIN